MESKNNELKNEYLKSIFEHNQGLIELADNKANIILGINSVMIPLIFGIAGINFINLRNLGILINAFILNTTIIISLGLFAVSFIFSVLVIKARTSKNNENMIFFEFILKNNIEDYQKKIIEMNEDDIIKDYLKEIYALAEINQIKYKRYQFALWLLVSGLIALFCGYVLIACFNYILL